MVNKWKGWPDWAYYLWAVLMTSFTIPMYHYRYAHASDDRPQPAYAAASPSSFYDAVPQPPAASGLARKPLLPGQLCEAGYVILKHGNAYTQGRDAAGRPARCMNGYRIESP
jgi:hypothetical protein